MKKLLLTIARAGDAGVPPQLHPPAVGGPGQEVKMVCCRSFSASCLDQAHQGGAGGGEEA